MVVLPSDHHIKGEKEYIDTLLEAIELANRRRGIVTIGITPTRPETGYGYIEMGDKLQTSAGAYKISRFTEKPNIEVAKDFLLKETYLWNSGIFVFRADVILREMEKYLPKIYKSLMEIYAHIGEDDEEEVIREQYNLIDGISIDFGIMQKTRKAYVIKGNFYWDDIGTFNALSRYLNKCSGNEISKNVYVQECENCSIFGDKNLIIGFGVKDLVIVDAGDVILVMDKNKDQEIKHLLNDLNENVYGQKVELTFNATLNDKAANDTGRPGFENDVKLEFSNNPDGDGETDRGETPWDTVVCFTYKINGLKINDHDLKLENAKFRLYSDKECKNDMIFS